MNKEDLKQGEYYFKDTGLSDVVFIHNDITTESSIKANYYLQVIRSSNSYYFEKDVQLSCNNLRLATPEEKHWLNKCIELNKFISKEEAMKTFNHLLYKLPEKWILDVNEENLELAKSFIHAHKNDYVGYRESWTITLDDFIKCYLHYPQMPDSHAHSYYEKHKGYTEITFEQFKKYVLKEETTKVNELKQPSKDASIEEILEYCKKKYPVGTKISNGAQYSNTISNGIIKDNYKINSINNRIWVDSEDGWYLCLYDKFNNYYAEILEESKKESTREVTVELGSRVYSLDEISKALTKEYDKVDVEDILKVIKTIR